MKGGGRLLTCVDQLAKKKSSFCKAYSSCSWRDGVAGSVFHLFFLCEDFREAMKRVMKHSEIFKKQRNERKGSNRLKRGIKNKEDKKKEKGTSDNMKRRGAKKSK
jgi:hypothetical protein